MKNWQCNLALLTIVFLEALFISGTAKAQTAFAPDWPVPVEITIRSEPTAIAQDGNWVIVYELSVFNPKHYPLNFISLGIGEPGQGQEFLFAGASLKGLVSRFSITKPDTPETINDPVTLAPGEQVMVYIWLTVKEDLPLPQALRHDFKFSATIGEETVTVVKAGPTLPVTKNERVISSPIRGGQWFVGNGFSNTSDHRRFPTFYDGMAIPQRFGADFQKLDELGGNAKPNWSTLEDFYSYNEPLFAVADGTVVRVVKGLPDRFPGQPHPVPMTWARLGGNYVVVQIGPKVFSLFAHLKPGTINVEVGQKVKEGDLIGLIGNSGNSTVPHLHFQLMDGEEPNGSEGIPFVFESFCEEVRDYTFTEIEELNDGLCNPHEKSIPGEKWVISFPE